MSVSKSLTGSDAREALAARAADPEPRTPLAKVEQPVQPVDAEELGVELWTIGDERVVYHHSIMMMCFLPQKRLPVHQREYVVRHGQAALRIEAGTLIDPGKVGHFKPLPVPYGSRARMILPYINAYAIRHRTRTVDLGRSLREFMTRIGLSFDGRRGVQITEQVQALAAAHLVLGLWEHNRSRALLATIADEVSFWLEKDARQRSLWEPEMVLTEVLRLDLGAARAARYGPPHQAGAIPEADGPLFLADVPNGADYSGQEGPCAVGSIAASVCSGRAVGTAVQTTAQPGSDRRSEGVFRIPCIARRPGTGARKVASTGGATRERLFPGARSYQVSAN